MSSGTKHREVVIVADADALARTVARQIVSAASEAIADRGQFTLVLSGGSTPKRAYQLLAEPQWKSKIDWSHTWLLFGDERCVPHDDERSNYHMAKQSLFDPAEISADQIIAACQTLIVNDPNTEPSPSEPLAVASQCAADYELRLRTFFASSDGEPPMFDLVLLGLGDDGHTASLFPGKPALRETKAWVAPSEPGVLPPPVDRVTMTYPVLNAAKHALFLVSGAGKATIVRDVLEAPCNPEKHPACGVQPRNGRLTWLLDEAAASDLSHR